MSTTKKKYNAYVAWCEYKKAHPLWSWVDTRYKQLMIIGLALELVILVVMTVMDGWIAWKMR